MPSPPRSAAAGSRPRARRRPTRRSRAACPTGNRRWGCRTARASRRPRASSCNARWATWGAPPRRSPRSRRPSARPATPRRPRAARRRTAWRRAVSRWTPIPDRRLAQRQGAGADRRQRPRQRRHRADRREGHPELGDLQRRPQHHGAIPPGSELGGAEPRQRSEGAPLADPRPDQGRRHGDDRQPQRRGVRRRRAGERAQPGGRGHAPQRRAVPEQRPVQRGRQDARFHRCSGQDRAASGRGHRDQPSFDRDPVRRLRPAAGPRGRQCRHHHHAQGPGGAGGRRQFRDQARPGHRGQRRLDHARQ